jgi:hypothetical protein
MGTITKPCTFSTGDFISADEMNAEFDTLYSLVNGQLDHNNLKSGAGLCPPSRKPQREALGARSVASH